MNVYSDDIFSPVLEENTGWRITIMMDIKYTNDGGVNYERIY